MGALLCRRSVEPILHTEAGDFLEVHEVAAEEEGVVGDADGGDFEVHRSDADALGLEAVKNCDGVVIKWKHSKFVQRFDGRLKALVWVKLRVSRFVFGHV